jgi:hypothetical protein
MEHVRIVLYWFYGRSELCTVTVWALPRSTLVRVGIAHVRSSIYVAHPTSESQFSAILPLSSRRYMYGGASKALSLERASAKGKMG